MIQNSDKGIIQESQQADDYHGVYLAGDLFTGWGLGREFQCLNGKQTTKKGLTDLWEMEYFVGEVGSQVGKLTEEPGGLQSMGSQRVNMTEVT